MLHNGTLFAGQALLADGWAENIRLSIDVRGRISAIETGVSRQAGDLDFSDRAMVPAPGNLHSHAFQRAMAGLTEFRSAKEDSFWSWRDLMYRFVASLDPEDIEAIAAGVQMEMLEAGYGACGEFHYLHHQPDGASYDDAGEMAARVAAAANTTGIGLTLLPVYYRRGGMDDRALAGGQLRFGCTRDRYEQVFSSAKNSISALGADCRLGVAPHSLRAVPEKDIAWLAQLEADGPVHIHIAEQTAEVDEVVDAYGARPVEWLLDNQQVDRRWCLIHATHMTPGEVSASARSGAVAGLCPITESNLGDGIFDGAGFLAAGGAIGIGSDSNVRIALAEELRTLEYSQRLRDRARAVLVQNGRSVGGTLFTAAAQGGARALGRGRGEIAVGEWADLTLLACTDIHTTGLEGDRLLDAWIFAGDDQLVGDVFSAGRHVVKHGLHIYSEQISSRFLQVLEKLRAEI